MTQGLIDLYSQIEFLDTRILRMNENQFGHIFMPSSYSNYLVIKQWSRPEDEQRLFEYIKPYVLGYDFGEEIEITHRNQYFELTPREEESYNDEKISFCKSGNR